VWRSEGLGVGSISPFVSISLRIAHIPIGISRSPHYSAQKVFPCHSILSGSLCSSVMRCSSEPISIEPKKTRCRGCESGRTKDLHLTVWVQERNGHEMHD
jgi:hypothetical protein